MLLPELPHFVLQILDVSPQRREFTAHLALVSPGVPQDQGYHTGYHQDPEERHEPLFRVFRDVATLNTLW